MFIFFLCMVYITFNLVEGKSQPHIVIAIADDLGWSDVSFQQHSGIRTPFIDKLALNGVRLTNHYSQPLCSPSRASLLTGKYPFHLGSGLETSVFFPAQEAALSPNEKLLPQYLKEAGYYTALIGKWHLGSSKLSLTPTKRGFDKHFGFYNGAIDYFLHNQTDAACAAEGKQASFLDFRNQTKPFRDKIGIYSTDLFNDEAERLIQYHDVNNPLFLIMSYQNVHDPLQAPADYIKKYDATISNKERKIYAAMASHLDDSVEQLRRSLVKKGLWDNTIFLLLSDNGGDPNEAGYNWPLRGSKGTVWEGGIRTICFLSGGYLNKQGIKVGREYEGLVHISDWFPTLLYASGISEIKHQIDGINLWPFLRGENGQSRDSILHNVNDNSYALRVGDWKLITEVDIGWEVPPEGTNHTIDFPKRPIDGEAHTGSFNNISLPRITDALYNIKKDPNERINLSKNNSIIVNKMKKIVEFYRKQVKKATVHFECNLRALRTAREKNVWGPFLEG